MRLLSIAAALALLATPALAEKTSLSVLKLASSGPVFLAQDLGHFAAEGLEVEFKFFAAAQPVAVAVVSGDAEFGVTGLTAGFYNLAGKGALKIIAGQSREQPGYKLSAYMVSNQAFAAGVRSPADFGGRSFAMTQVGSTFHYMIGLLAEKKGFDLSKNRLLALQSIPNMVSALQGGQADTAILPSTVAVPMMDRGDAKIVGWAGDETPWQLGALFTSPKMIDTKKATVERFVRAYKKGVAAYDLAFQKKGDQAATDKALDILARYTEQQKGAIAAGLPYIEPEARFSARDIAKQVAYWQAQGQADKSIEAKDIVVTTFVSSID
ncbi:MAG: ABC transporter substrate-binding protein [Rhodospirillaceae bacterium]|nr:ABC transporter substrate-binding protein [Rhodospirillaceae bacterium]